MLQLTMPTLNRVAPELPVPDLREAIGYYERNLGFALAMEHHGYAIVERDRVAIHLFLDTGKEHSPVGIHIFTDQIEELYAELKGSGARISQEIERKPWGNRDFRVTDPAGNVIKFTEPLPLR
jgi:uncharacterized glyoxalase superfamily protein PhnB